MKRYENSYELWNKAKSVILNGVQTISKSPEHITLGATPVYIKKGKGAYIWDVDGNKYIDFPCALGPVILGYADKRVDSVVKRQIDRGVIFSLSSPLELKLAEIMGDIIPSAEKVRFLKSGSEAMSAAVRIARAYTNKEVVAVCGYHGWHDWTAVRMTRNAGVPKNLKKLIYEFKYNDIDSLEKIFSSNNNKVAAVVLEPVGMYEPIDDFLKKVASLARKNGALLIFDEIVTGFRLSLGGAQSYFSVIPDLSVFGKAMANGYPISAVAGKRKIMDAVEESIFISSTYGGELISIAAAIETIEILKKYNINSYILGLGKRLKDGLNSAIRHHDINAVCEGMNHKTFLLFSQYGKTTAKIQEAYFRQECFKRGVFLGYGHFISSAHKKADIDLAINVASEVFADMAILLKNNTLYKKLDGSQAADVFKRY